MKRAALATILVATLGGKVAADPDAEADAAYRAAVLRTDPEVALRDLEALGAQRPVTRWTDNAWMEAARRAEQGGDFARARRDLERAIADATDPQVTERARATLARLAQTTGSGAWDAVVQQHTALLAELGRSDDPEVALGKLDALVRAHPTYPRATSIRVAIARGWELEGERTTALQWMREAAAAAGDDPGERTRLELARMLVRARELAEARATLRTLARSPRVDAAARDEVGRMLEAATTRTWIRRGVSSVLALLGALALWVLRRDLGSWRAVGRRLVRPPLEVIVIAPLAAILVVIAAPGNPLVSRAVTTIVIAGLIAAWLSGVVGDAGRAAPHRARRTLLHVVAVMLAIAGIGYLAVERGVLDLLLETWRGGHALP